MNIVVGFVLLLLIGAAASRLTLFQGRFSLGAQSLFTAGVEFLFIGLIAGPRAANVLSEEALHQLSPVLSLGLGWIGLLIGLQFDRRDLLRIPAPIWLMGATISFAAFGLLFILFLLSIPWLFQNAGLVIQEADKKNLQQATISLSFLLSWISATSAYSALALLKRNIDARGETFRLIQLLTEVRSPIAIAIVGLWYGIHHSTMLQYPSMERWLTTNLPVLASNGGSSVTPIAAIPVMGGVEWVMMTLLLGALLGWMVHYLTNRRLAQNELLLILTGAVILSGGLSSHLHLSPLFVNMVMGTTLTNLPNFTRSRITKWMVSNEKPFFVVFMILAGALWPPITPLTLGITVVYCAGRTMGLWMGAWAASRWFYPHKSAIPKRLGLTMLPQGGVALALAVDFYLIYPGALADLALGVVILAVIVQQVLGPSVAMSVLRASGNAEKSRRGHWRYETSLPPPAEESPE
ncbi:MAG: hypothetical protein JXR73_16910 [Candidatus Omnitrophica bacterium]|nr:hypothetical protein [Candidatus Omnitrophota bacterium]